METETLGFKKQSQNIDIKKRKTFAVSDFCQHETTNVCWTEPVPDPVACMRVDPACPSPCHPHRLTLSPPPCHLTDSPCHPHPVTLTLPPLQSHPVTLTLSPSQAHPVTLTLSPSQAHPVTLAGSPFGCWETLVRLLDCARSGNH